MDSKLLLLIGGGAVLYLLMNKGGGCVGVDGKPPSDETLRQLAANLASVAGPDEPLTSALSRLEAKLKAESGSAGLNADTQMQLACYRMAVAKYPNPARSLAIPAPVSTMGPVTPVQVVAPPVTTTTEPPSGNSLAAIYARMQAAANSAKMVTGSPDQWNWLLGQVSSLVPPDPLEVWPSYDRTAGMTLSLDQYWGTMSAYLRTSRGMGGFRRQRSYAHPAMGWIT